MRRSHEEPGARTAHRETALTRDPSATNLLDWHCAPEPAVWRRSTRGQDGTHVIDGRETCARPECNGFLAWLTPLTITVIPRALIVDGR